MLILNNRLVIAFVWLSSSDVTAFVYVAMIISLSSSLIVYLYILFKNYKLKIINLFLIKLIFMCIKQYLNYEIFPLWSPISKTWLAGATFVLIIVIAVHAFETLPKPYAGMK